MPTLMSKQEFKAWLMNAENYDFSEDEANLAWEMMSPAVEPSSQLCGRDRLLQLKALAKKVRDLQKAETRISQLLDLRNNFRSVC